MGFFSTKKVVKLEDFCRDFYENILGGVFLGVDVGEFKEYIIQVFPEFSNIDSNRVKEEFTIIRFELFALAWQNTFDEDLSIAQSVFTLLFLKEKNKQDIWERMDGYNGAISAGIRKSISSTQRDGQILDMGRYQLFEKYTNKAKEQGIDIKKELHGNAIARVANRIKSNRAWKDGQGMAPYYLSLKLLRILGYTDTELEKITDNQQISAYLMTLMKNFYNEAKESLEDVKIIN